MRSKVTTIIVFLITLCVLSSLCISCSSDKYVADYADNFLNTMNKEMDALEKMNSAFSVVDYNTKSSIVGFQGELSQITWILNNCLNSYQSAYPNNSPQDLKDAVNFAREGTSKVIAGLTSVNTSLSSYDAGPTTVSYNQMKSGATLINDGAKVFDQASSKYNQFADAYNSKRSSPNIFVGILIGTGILWLLSLLVVNPLAKFFAKREVALAYSNGSLPQDENEVTRRVNGLTTRTFIFTDIIILGIAGFLLGRLVGWYFIGISWKIKRWPGLVVFFGMSFLGRYLYG